MSPANETAAALIAGLDRGESLPAHWYTDSAITEREIQHIFRKTWSYIGPLNELKNVGDYITGNVGEIPVVVIRNENGLTALVNVCRHRRHQVMKGRGNAKMMQCGYHAWTYDLTGCLKGAPRTAHEPNFRLEDYPLLPLRVDTLGPWVFVNADNEAAPMASQYGKLLDIIAETGLDLDSLQLYSRDEWGAPANWKTMLENFEECYHCAVAHPGLKRAGRQFKAAGGHGGKRAHFGAAVFALVGGGDVAAEGVGQELHAVADAEHRLAAGQDVGRELRRAGVVDGVVAAGEDDPPGPILAHESVRNVGGMDLAVDLRFAHAPRDQLRVLRAEVEDDDALADRRLFNR